MDDRAERLNTERAEQREEMGGVRGASCKGRAERWDEGHEASGMRELMNFYGYFHNSPSAQR